MSSAQNHMARSHRSERRKPGQPGGQNFSRSKYHRIRSARPGLLAGLLGAARYFLRRRKSKSNRKEVNDNGDQEL